MTQYGASALTSKVRRMPASVASVSGAPVTTPALFTTTSTSGLCRLAWVTASVEVTSTATASASAPRTRTSAATAPADSAATSQTITWAAVPRVTGGTC